MTVYRSETRLCAFEGKFRTYNRYAYLLADTDEELHSFAATLGLKREWFQGPPKHAQPHYDLLGEMIPKAENQGATLIKIRDFIRNKRAGEPNDTRRD